MLSFGWPETSLSVLLYRCALGPLYNAPKKLKVSSRNISQWVNRFEKVPISAAFTPILCDITYPLATLFCFATLLLWSLLNFMLWNLPLCSFPHHPKPSLHLKTGYILKVSSYQWKGISFKQKFSCSPDVALSTVYVTIFPVFNQRKALSIPNIGCHCDNFKSAHIMPVCSQMKLKSRFPSLFQLEAEV